MADEQQGAYSSLPPSGSWGPAPQPRPGEVALADTLGASAPRQGPAGSWVRDVRQAWWSTSRSPRPGAPRSGGQTTQGEAPGAGPCGWAGLRSGREVRGHWARGEEGALHLPRGSGDPNQGPTLSQRGPAAGSQSQDGGGLPPCRVRVLLTEKERFLSFIIIRPSRPLASGGSCSWGWPTFSTASGRGSGWPELEAAGAGGGGGPRWVLAPALPHTRDTPPSGLRSKSHLRPPPALKLGGGGGCRDPACTLRPASSLYGPRPGGRDTGRGEAVALSRSVSRGDWNAVRLCTCGGVGSARRLPR